MKPQLSRVVTPVFLIIGPPQNGKSTVREAITTLAGVKGGSCSEIIYAHMATKRGCTVAHLKTIQKELLRPDLVSLGDWLCGFGNADSVDGMPDPDRYQRCRSYLIRALFNSGNRVIDGVRRRPEMQDSLRFLKQSRCQPYVIHVEKPDAPKISDNTSDMRDLADVCLLNDGTTAELSMKVAEMLRAWNVIAAAPAQFSPVTS